MKIEDLKELLELVSERNIAELVLEEEGVKLKIRKVVAPAAGSAEAAQVVAVQPPQAVEARPPAPASAPEAGSGAGVEDGLSIVKSPIVGTFYRQPEPGAEPFAREGDRVTKGQVLCIIEAMKLMNEIESEFQGELVKVFVENGQPVQYDDPLFAIREY